MSDFNRKQFEDYYNDWGGFGCQYCLHHRMGDSYNIPDVAKAWRHWQASRECLVIELPADAHLSRDGLDEHYLAGDMRDQIVESIHAAGVKTI